MRGPHPVTRRRMAEAKAAHPRRHLVMRCACNPHGFSADDGDYWLQPEHEAFLNCRACGEAFELGYTQSEWVPV